MNQTNNKKPDQQILCIFFLQIAANISILFNIPVARQVISFTFFTFIPGYALIKLLKMKMRGLTETVLLSTGLSITFLMLIGLIINGLYSIFAVQTPLSLIFLLPAMNIFTLTCTIIAYLRNRNNEPLDLSLEKPSSLLILLCIPTLSIIGAITSGVYGDNRILLFTIIAIAAVFAVAIIPKKAIPTKLYPFIVLIIAISLIYHSTLISENLIHFGSDVCGEVFAQKNVGKNAYWNPINPYPGDESVGRTYAMLSVTMLPTIYSSLLNLDSILVFKLFYSLLFALVPLGLYNLWKNFVGEKFAFISAFFFMSFQIFYGEMLGLNKQMLGELFLVLLLTVILNERKDKSKKIACSLLFSFALVVSHYALAEIFLFFISFALIASMLTKKPSKNVTPTFVLYFFVIMFAWYIFTSSSSVFDAFTTFGQRVYNELGDFFNPGSRGQEILRGLGLESPPTVWNLISRIFAYITEALIAVGFISIILKRTKVYSEKEYFFLVFVSILFLGALIVVPGLASTMNMTRFYHILLFFIAPLCVIGAESIIEFLVKRKDILKTSVLMIIVLVPYFLFQIGFVYELTNSPSWSLPLSKYGMSQVEAYYTFGYLDGQCISAAKWLSNEITVSKIGIFADIYSRVNELRAYSGIYAGYVQILSNVTQLSTQRASIVYLNPSNVIEGMLVRGNYFWNVSELQFLNDMSNVYTNGGSEVFYKNAP